MLPLYLCFWDRLLLDWIVTWMQLLLDWSLGRTSSAGTIRWASIAETNVVFVVLKGKLWVALPTISDIVVSSDWILRWTDRVNFIIPRRLSNHTSVLVNLFWWALQTVWNMKIWIIAINVHLRRIIVVVKASSNRGRIRRKVSLINRQWLPSTDRHILILVCMVSLMRYFLERWPHSRIFFRRTIPRQANRMRLDRMLRRTLKILWRSSHTVNNLIQVQINQFDDDQSWSFYYANSIYCGIYDCCYSGAAASCSLLIE